MKQTPIVTTAEMREIERLADEVANPTFAQMMRNAGQAAARMIFERIRRSPRFNPRAPSETRVLVLCGKGNNGGDGMCCAKELARLGVTPQIYMLVVNARRQPGPITDFVRATLKDLIADGIYIDGVEATGDGRLQRLGDLWSLLIRADVVVDALLGSGVSRPIEGDLREVLRELGNVRETLKADKLPLLVALDGVTGMNFDTGELDPAAVAADLTITFHAPKRGHYSYPAAEAGGELMVADIAIGTQRRDEEAVPLMLPKPATVLADDDLIGPLLPSRRRDANKGTHGRPLIIGGCDDFVGAPALSASAAYRAGAGVVNLAVPQSVKPIAAAVIREATFITLHDSVHALTPESVEVIARWIAMNNNRSPVLLGPGMSQAESAGRFVDAFLTALAPDLVGRLLVDADGLNLLAKRDDWPALLPAGTILTPHDGEMSRLTRTSLRDVQRDHIGNALRYAAEWGHIVLLKGPHTVVAEPGGRAIVMPFANPAMATAGTGDVLAGCITGLLGQGLTPFDAAVCGAYMHGKAGERWREAHGEAGMLAGDLLGYLPEVLRDVQKAA
jgi:ADP-dependent NAD(P)H-hydrate dehydratase / NAD(P)H-hydrate epimerase